MVSILAQLSSLVVSTRRALRVPGRQTRPVIICTTPVVAEGKQDVAYLSEIKGNTVRALRAELDADISANSNTILQTLEDTSNTARFRGMETRPMETHLGICLSFSQKYGNSLAWVLVALTVCYTYPVLYRSSAESRAGGWEL